MWLLACSVGLHELACSQEELVCFKCASTSGQGRCRFSFFEAERHKAPADVQQAVAAVIAFMFAPIGFGRRHLQFARDPLTT